MNNKYFEHLTHEVLFHANIKLILIVEVINMKKVIIFLVCTVMTLSLCACGGNVKNVNVVDVESELYTSDDINSAIETIIKEFDKKWKGCTLKEIYYAGDEISSNYQDWADRNNAEEA